jgi:hypothetical protein
LSMAARPRALRRTWKQGMQAPRVGSRRLSTPCRL